MDKGLNESMGSELINWIDDHLAPESNYHSTDYELSIDDDGILLKCTATWGGWLYDDLHSIEELFTEEIIEILMPDYEYENVNLDSLSLPFQYTDDDNGYGFNWLSDVAEYYDEEKDLNLEIPLKDLKQTLEPIFHKDPRNQDHYEYYQRCVNRFRDLLNSNSRKLFLMFISPENTTYTIHCDFCAI